MTVSIYILLIFLLSLVSMLIYIVINDDISKFLNKNFKYLLGLLLLALIFKLPFDFIFFYGQEYEDSYLASSSSRYLLYNQDQVEHPFQVHTCGVGSLSNCEVSISHSGNLIGLPVLLWAINHLFGFSVNLVSLFNFSCTILSVIGIFYLGYKISSNYLLGLIAAGIYIMTPVLSSFHTSGLFETFSSTMTLFSLILFIDYYEYNLNSSYNIKKILIFFTLILVSFASIHIKRENIILVLFPIISLLCTSLNSRRLLIAKLKELIPFGIFIIGLLIYYFFVLKVGISISIENEYAKGFPFQFEFFIPLLKMFIQGYGNLKWFYFFGILLVVSIPFIIYDLKANPYLLYPLLLLLILIFINTVHHRSYYFVRSGSVTAFESLRHINLMSPYYAIISGYVIYKIWRYLKRRSIKNSKISFIIIILFTVGLAAHLMKITYSLRKEFIANEQYDRILPMQRLISTVNEVKDIAITDQSVLLYNYCSPQLRVIEFSVLGNIISEEAFENILMNNSVYLLKHNYFNEPIFYNRYKKSFEIIDKFSQEVVFEEENYKILSIKQNGKQKLPPVSN